MALRWLDFILPSTLQLAPLLEVLIEPVCCRQMQGQVQLGLHEALVNAVRHGNGCDPAKYLRVRRIETPCWLIWQVQDQGPGVEPAARIAALPQEPDAASGRGLYLITTASTTCAGAVGATGCNWPSVGSGPSC